MSIELTKRLNRWRTFQAADGSWEIYDGDRHLVAKCKDAESLAVHLSLALQDLRSLNETIRLARDLSHRRLLELQLTKERVKALEGFAEAVSIADGELSAIAHGRPPSSKDELLALSGGLRRLAAVLRDSTGETK